MLIGILSVILFQNFIMAHPHEEPSFERKGLQEESLSELFFNNDPFTSMRKMREQMMRDFEKFNDFESFDLKKNNFGFYENSARSYTVNSKETDDSLVYEVELKNNVEGDSINVSVENRVVTISGKKNLSNKNEEDDVQSFFSSSSSFSQSFTVPSNVDSENVKITNEGKKIILIFPKIIQ